MVYHSTLLYRVCFSYFAYHHHLREMQHEMLQKHYKRAVLLLKQLMKELDEIEDLCRGGFVEILVKVKYAKRSNSYYLNTLEAELLSKEIGQKTDEEETSHKNNTFTDDMKFLMNLLESDSEKKT